jgi:hypothetical protein
LASATGRAAAAGSRPRRRFRRWPTVSNKFEEKLADGRLQFWPGERSAAVTQVAVFGGRKALIVRYGGGELDELLAKIEPALCAVARAMGCSLIMSEGRMGWKKAAEGNGYRFAWLTMLKEI